MRHKYWLIVCIGCVFIAINVGTGTYLWLLIKREHYSVAGTAGHGMLNVLDYGAKCDGKSDDGGVFAEALEDGFRNQVSIYIPKRTCVIARTLEVKSGTVIRSDGAVLVHAKDSGSLLSAVSADDWVIDGPITLLGNRTATQKTGGETGLFISGANRFIVNQLTVRSFTGVGIEITGGKPSRAARGDRGKFAFVTINDNQTGMVISDGKKYSAEYNLFTLMSFSGNDTAIKVLAGNNIITAANIVDNASGVLLGKGLNDGHGIISAVNINHNRAFNVQAKQVTHGFTFNGCHVYGDNQQSVELQESNDITFTGCVLDPLPTHE